MLAALGCAPPCVDDGSLEKQHDASCKPAPTVDGTTAEATTGGSTPDGPTTGGLTTSVTTTTPDPTTAATSTDPDGTGTSTTGDIVTSGDHGTASDSDTGNDTGVVCGDNVVEGTEACDDGPNNGDDKTCKTDCTDQACGDGFTGPGEGCDDGNTMDLDGCAANCVLESCGDGVTQLPEECDDGANADPDDGCTDLCTLPVCGDGYVQPSLLEECDDGVSNGDQASCKSDCTDQACGDGFVGPGESCDDGNMMGGDGCDAACVPETCGDGVTQPPEACDDGANGDQDDGCTDACALPACGDGYVQMAEACDDGVNNSDEGACTLACEAAVCGDGLMHMGVEACDDGVNNSDVGACTTTCVAATCGDGLVHLGVEKCDDGNVNDADLCDNDCSFNYRVSTKGGSTCIQFDGKLRCWGRNNWGILGQGHTLYLGDGPGELPTPDIAVGGTVLEHALGAFSSCVLLDTGAIKCWGYGNEGALGINSTTNIGDGPGEMPPIDAKVGEPAAGIGGGFHFCAITAGGALRCWGRNGAGQLGQGHTNQLGDQPGELPLQSDIPVGFPVVEIGTGQVHMCARSAAGAVRCWGGNTYGQLGRTGAANIGDQPGELPTMDVALGGAVAELAVGDLHNCVLMVDGAVRCWGNGQYGRLGNGSQDSVGLNPGDMPPDPVNLGGTAIQVVVSAYHTCALMEDGKARCFGRNSNGQLGLGNTNDIGDGPGEMPPPPAVLGGTVVQLSQGMVAQQQCALLDTLQLRCWGWNTSGQLGLGHVNTIGDDELPTSQPFVPYKL